MPYVTIGSPGVPSPFDFFPSVWVLFQATSQVPGLETREKTVLVDVFVVLFLFFTNK